MCIIFLRVKSLEEDIEKLSGQLNEKKEQIESMEKSIETMKKKNNVSLNPGVVNEPLRPCESTIVVKFLFLGITREELEGNGCSCCG